VADRWRQLATLEPAPVAGRPAQLPASNLRHLRRLTNQVGIWEHAEFDLPRPEHSFCTDDNARALVVACRHGTGPGVTAIATTTLRFVLDARDRHGRLRNRWRADAVWLEQPRSDDAEDRAVWALGTAARLAPDAAQRRDAGAAFTLLEPLESTHLRPHATAALGAAEVLALEPNNAVARRLITDAATRIASATQRGNPWIEPRLTYDDARLPAALLAAAAALHDRDLLDLGLEQLWWLAEEQTLAERFSFTPVGGRAAGGARPAFDQQPLDAAAMGEACARAWSLTGDALWRSLAERAARWFLGDNDTGTVLYDRSTGGTFDGLTADGANLNRGAESTIAGIAALQAAASCRGPGGR
jgi:hypothetical protein